MGDPAQAGGVSVDRKRDRRGGKSGEITGRRMVDAQDAGHGGRWGVKTSIRSAGWAVRAEVQT